MNMAANNQVYGPDIRDAIASGDLIKMKVLLVKAKSKIKENLDLFNATFELEDAIKLFDKKKN